MSSSVRLRIPAVPAVLCLTVLPLTTESAYPIGAIPPEGTLYPTDPTEDEGLPAAGIVRGLGPVEAAWDVIPGILTLTTPSGDAL